MRGKLVWAKAVPGKPLGGRLTRLKSVAAVIPSVVILCFFILGFTLFGFILLGFVTVSGMAPSLAAPALAQDTEPAEWRPLTLGLHTGPDPQRIAAYMPVAAALGAAVVPVDFAWERVQPAADRFDWEDYDFAVRRTRTHGLTPIGVLLYPTALPLPQAGVVGQGWPAPVRGEWLHFVEQVVSRYAWAVSDWIVVRDEPDDVDPLLWASEAADYARFVRETAAAIRRAQPGARVRVAVSAVDLRWLEVFIREGGLEGAAGLVLEVNRWPAPPEGLQVVVADVRALAQQLGYSPELWVWRLGYPTHGGVSRTAPHRTGVTGVQQAQYVVRGHVWLAQAGVDLILWHELMDSGWEPDAADSNFGLLRRDGRLKPAADAYRTLSAELGGRTYGLPQPSLPLESDEVTVEALAMLLAALRDKLGGSNGQQLLSSVAVHPFAAADGESLVVVIWIATNPPLDGPVAALSLNDVAVPQGARLVARSWTGAPMEQLIVGPEPVYVEIVAVPVKKPKPGSPTLQVMME